MSDPVALPPAPYTPLRVFGATIVVVATVLAFLLLYVFAKVLFYFFVGVILATAVQPVVMWLRARGVSPTAATVGVYGSLLLILVGLLSWFVPLVVQQAGSLGENLPRTYSQLTETLNTSSNKVLQRLGKRLPTRVADTPAPVSDDKAVEQLADALTYGNWVFEGLLSILAVLLIAFYWSLQEDRLLRTGQLLLPPGRRDSFREFIATVQSKLGAYVRGQLILCLSVGVLNFIAFLIIGLPYATTLGIFAGVLEAIPVFGPVLGAVAPAAIALTNDPHKLIYVLVAATVIQQLENYVLVPRIMQGSVGVNPVVTLLAIAGFGALMGLAGAILAIPLAALVQLILDRWLLDPEALEPTPPSGRDATSVVRYHARELLHDVRLYLRNKAETSSTRHDAIEEATESIALDVDRMLAAQGASEIEVVVSAETLT